MGKNGYYLDRKVEQMTGYPNMSVISRQAFKRGLLKDKNPIAEFHLMKKIKLADTQSANFKIPKFVVNFFSKKPFINNELCEKCFKCYKSCPPQAIMKNNDKLIIDYSKCIRCFCCHELCIYEAVTLKKFYFFR
jgi:Fe-S-cluster-containing hydrogenase component 2